MALKKITRLCMAVVMYFAATGAYAADPDWNDENQAMWGALEDTNPATPIPQLYPYAECGIGKKQSPIDIVTADTVKTRLNNINTHYVSSALEIENNGHTIKVNTPMTSNPDHFMVGAEKFTLMQVHFHTPSEHTIDGKVFPMEAHFVHFTDSGKLAVVGVLMETGTPDFPANPAFQVILNNAPNFGAPKVPNVTVALNQLLPKHEHKFYNYLGSLTTPPCSEGIDWYVLQQAIKISNAQLAQFQSFYHANTRETQALNTRVVSKL